MREVLVTNLAYYQFCNNEWACLVVKTPKGPIQLFIGTGMSQENLPIFPNRTQLLPLLLLIWVSICYY